MSKTNCATLSYFTKYKKHAEVKHLVPGTPDWATRLKSNELYSLDATSQATAGNTHDTEHVCANRADSRNAWRRKNSHNVQLVYT